MEHNICDNLTGLKPPSIPKLSSVGDLKPTAVERYLSTYSKDIQKPVFEIFQFGIIPLENSC